MLLGTFLSFMWTLNASPVVLGVDKRQDRVLFMAWTTGFLSLSLSVSRGASAWLWIFVPLLLPFVLFFCVLMRVKEKLYGYLSIRELQGYILGPMLKWIAEFMKRKEEGLQASFVRTGFCCVLWERCKMQRKRDISVDLSLKPVVSHMLRAAWGGGKKERERADEWDEVWQMSIKWHFSGCSTAKRAQHRWNLQGEQEIERGWGRGKKTARTTVFYVSCWSKLDYSYF